VGNSLPDEVIGRVDIRQRLLKIDDVDSAALREDKALDFRVPPAGLVSKVDTAVEQLSNGYGSHCCTPFVVFG
jgi:hypothetical protein